MSIAAELLQRHIQTLVDDHQQWQRLIADNILWELAYAPAIGHPAQLSGRDEVLHHVRWFLGAVENFRFIDPKVYAFTDPQAAVAQVKAEALIKPTGRIYRQEYVVFLRAAGDKIAYLPIPRRDPAHVCRHYRRLVKTLEPGDYIVSFSWDSLMADALLCFCPFWYPRTGFGPWQLDAITGVRAKSLSIQSLVHLHHIHGSVLLFELLEKGPDSLGTGHLLYLGPPGYTEMNSLMSLLGVSKESPEPRRDASDLEKWAVGRGYLYISDRWFRPLFVPPSFEKGEYAHPYHSALRRRIHTLLPRTDVYVIIGYSFPPADFNHPSAIFVPAVMQASAELIAVDRSSPDPEFQSRVKRIFPNMKEYDFTNTDFKSFGAEPDENVATIFA